jgi:hypothetical protein
VKRRPGHRRPREIPREAILRTSAVRHADDVDLGELLDRLRPHGNVRVLRKAGA